MNEKSQIIFNGINASTGGYFFETIDPAELAKTIRVQLQCGPVKKSPLIRPFSEMSLAGERGVDLENPKAAGWGVVFPDGLDPKIKDAVGRLVDHRRKLLGKTLVRELSYTAPATSASWKSDLGLDSSRAVRAVVPYYLLLVGNTEQIPFFFEQGLSSVHAVGRLTFDSASEFEFYVDSVIRHENGKPRRTVPEVAFFATHHKGDEATAYSCNELVKPLAQESYVNLSKISLLEPDATKEKLLALLRRPLPPAVLFTATHGLWMEGKPAAAGSILCQNWAGLNSPATSADFFAAEDITSDMNLEGMISFHLACFGAGVPRCDVLGADVIELGVDRTSELPKALLGRCGMLAFAGHLGRTLDASFRLNPDHSDISAFRDMLELLDTNRPIGYALQDLRQRGAESARDLQGLSWQIRMGDSIPDILLCNTWMKSIDANGFLLLGDPAVSIQRAQSNWRLQPWSTRK